MTDSWIRFSNEYSYNYTDTPGQVIIKDFSGVEIILPLQMVNQIAKRAKAFYKVRTV